MILSLLETPTKINLPDSIYGWMGLGLYCLLFFLCMIHWWDIPLSVIRRKWQLLVFLFIAIVPANLFLGIGSNTLESIPDLNGQMPGMVFSAVPWFLISAFFGPVLGGMAGLFSGFLQAFWSTNSLFTPFILAISASLAGVCFRQKYRGGIYSAFRHPIGAAGFAAFSAYLLSSVSAFVSAGNLPPVMVDAFLMNWRTDLISFVFPMMIAGIIGEGLYKQKIGPWRRNVVLLPSTDEGFAESKFWRIALPVSFLFIFIFSQITWNI
ncbi:MAG TPA: hypothetical protein VF338_02295, partial [Leptolinea sp.]